MLDDEAAQTLCEDHTVNWYQQFHLSENVVTPGLSAKTVEWTLERAGVPERLDGLSVLDIGTSNGGAAFLAEERGAARVVAVDLCRPDWFAFDQIGEALGSKAHFVQASVYELPEILNESFDVVFFFGVLYHLRHPLLAADSLRSLTRGTLFVETAISGSPEDPPVAQFCRLDELSGDGTNWFVPTVSCMRDWFVSSGFEERRVSWWPDEAPTRALFVGTPVDGPAEYETISYESPLHARVAPRTI